MAFPLFLSQAADLSLEALQALLQSQDPQVQLLSFEQQAQSASHAQNFRFLLNDAQARPGLPSSLYLKICALKEHFVPDSEIHCYTRDYRGLQAAPLLRCYAAGGDQQSYFLRLQDVGETHYSNKDVRPSPAHAQAAVPPSGIAICKALSIQLLRFWLC